MESSNIALSFVESATYCFVELSLMSGLESAFAHVPDRETKADIHDDDRARSMFLLNSSNRCQSFNPSFSPSSELTPKEVVLACGAADDIRLDIQYCSSTCQNRTLFHCTIMYIPQAPLVLTLHLCFLCTPID